MARLIDDIELAWHSLGDSADASGWRSISIAKIGPCSLLAGLSFPEKSEALLASFSASSIPAAEKLPDGQGFAVSRAEPKGDGLTWLALTRSPHGSLELFAAMVADVAHAMDAEPGADEKRLLRVFLGRIRAWQEFTDFEYGSDWARFSRAAAKRVRCSRRSAGWYCDVEARPCR